MGRDTPSVRRGGGRWSATVAACLAVVLAGLFLAVVVLPTDPAGALTLAQQKAAAEARTAQVKQLLDALNTSLEQAIQQYDLANLKLNDVQARVSSTTLQLALATSQLQTAEQKLGDSVVAMYEQRPTDILDVIFSSRSFDDLTSQVSAFRELGAGNAQIVAAVQTYQTSVQQQRDQLVVAQDQARALLQDVLLKKAGIETAVARQKDIFASAKAEVAKITQEEAAQEARAAAAARAAIQSGVWRNPRRIPSGSAGPGHPEVIAIARKYLGIPYVYGAADPKVGFDCSGLVMYCYAQIGIQLPHYSGYQQNMGVPVPMNALIPGDLVFMGYPVSYHVALYAGGGQVIEAPHTGDVVKYWPVSGFEFAVRLL
jgi:cell wall-associated NlpC family hydrolase